MRRTARLLADSREREGPDGAITSEPLPPPPDHGPMLAMIGWIYDRVLVLLPHAAPTTLVDITPVAPADPTGNRT